MEMTITLPIDIEKFVTPGELKDLIEEFLNGKKKTIQHDRDVTHKIVFGSKVFV